MNLVERLNVIDITRGTATLKRAIGLYHVFFVQRKSNVVSFSIPKSDNQKKEKKPQPGIKVAVLAMIWNNIGVPAHCSLDNFQLGKYLSLRNV